MQNYYMYPILAVLVSYGESMMWVSANAKIADYAILVS